MELDNLPQFRQKNSLRNIIIKELSYEWPQTTKKIHYIVKKKYGVNVTYQAVHKMLNKLVEEEIISKKGKEFFINIKWIEELEKFATNTKKQHLRKKPLFLEGLEEFREEGNTKIFVFDSLENAENYRKKLQLDYGYSNTKEPYCSQSIHMKSPLFYSEKSIKIVDSIKKSKKECFLLVKGNTKIDKWCANYYRNKFVKIITGIPCAKNCDLMVLGDQFTEMYYPKDLIRMIDRKYSAAKEMSAVNIPKFFKEIYQKKTKIKFTVTKNKTIAEEVRKYILTFFKSKKKQKNRC